MTAADERAFRAYHLEEMEQFRMEAMDPWPGSAAPETTAAPADGDCVVCGGESDGDVCSSGCGYELTGEYPPMFEKDYGDE